jgi:chromosome segregation ATPase
MTDDSDGSSSSPLATTGGGEKRNVRVRPYWWVWSTIGAAAGIVALVLMVPGWIALRGFETAQSSWIADQQRRTAFRVEADGERQSLQKSIDDNKAKLIDAESKVAIATEQVRTFTPQIAQLEQVRKDLATAKQQQLVAETGRDSAIQELERLGGQIKQLQSQQSSLTSVVSDLKSLQAEREQILKDVANATESLSKSRVAAASAAEQLASVQRDLVTVQASKAAEDGRLKALRENQQQAAVLDAQIAQRQQQADRLRIEIATYNERLDGLKSRMDDELKAMTASRDLRKAEIEREIKLQNELRESAAAQVLVVQSGLTSLKAEESRLRQQNQALLTDQQAAVGKLKDLAPLIGSTFDAFMLQMQRMNKQLQDAQLRQPGVADPAVPPAATNGGDKR